MVRTYGQLYQDALHRLMQVEEEKYANQLTRELLRSLSGKSRAEFLRDHDREAPPELCQKVEDALQRLCHQEPLAYVLGEWSFYGMDLYVDENVLIPRDDTCALVDVALQRGKLLGENLQILDLCTGSGCIGLALASRLKNAQVTLADISDGALAVAQKNVQRLGLRETVRCVRVDARSTAPDALGQFHMIVSNPPYISTADMQMLDSSVKDFEPHLALHGGDDGLIFYRSIVKNFTKALRPGGLLAFEFGEGQGDEICRIMQAHGFTILDRVLDYNRTERACLARYDRKEE